jgi:hypothetical protein
MSQDYTIHMTFEDEEAAELALEQLGKISIDANEGDDGTQVMFDACLAGEVRSPQDYWKKVLKPALKKNKPVIIEFGTFEYVEAETIVP